MPLSRNPGCWGARLKFVTEAFDFIQESGSEKGVFTSFGKVLGVKKFRLRGAQRGKWKITKPVSGPEFKLS